MFAAGLVTGQLQLLSVQALQAGQGAAGAAGDADADTSTGPATGAAGSIGHRQLLVIAAPGGDQGGDEPPTCRAVRFTADGGRVAAGYSDAGVVMYDVAAGGRLVVAMAGAHGSELSRMLCVDEHLMASGDEQVGGGAGGGGVWGGAGGREGGARGPGACGSACAGEGGWDTRDEGGGCMQGRGLWRAMGMHLGVGSAVEGEGCLIA